MSLYRLNWASESKLVQIERNLGLSKKVMAHETPIDYSFHCGSWSKFHHSMHKKTLSVAWERRPRSNLRVINCNSRAIRISTNTSLQSSEQSLILENLLARASLASSLGCFFLRDRLSLLFPMVAYWLTRKETSC